MLGERLARAVRQSMLADERADGRFGAKVMDESRQHRATSDGQRKILRPVGTIPSSTTVTVDRLLGSVRLLPGPVVDREAPTGGSRVPTRPVRPIAPIRHRTVVRYSTGSFAKYGTRHDDPSAPGNRGTILVVSPSQFSGGVPGLSAVAASAMAERLGFEVGTVALSSDSELILDIRGATLDLVVLVVEGERESTL